MTKNEVLNELIWRLDQMSTPASLPAPNYCQACADAMNILAALRFDDQERVELEINRIAKVRAS